jgi:hypothetical protein
MSERILRKTVTHEVIEKLPTKERGSTTEKAFTTQPKTRRHARHSISGNRCRHFMLHLWRQGFRESCHYKALRIQFIRCFETNDARVIEKYIGRPAGTKRYVGSSVVRQNRNTGRIAYFLYSNQRNIEAKTGLMELLGYPTLDKKSGWATLYHEEMPYYTKQTVLTRQNSAPTFGPICTDDCVPPSNSPLQEFDEGSGAECSIDNLCVCSIEAGGSKGQWVSGNSGEVEEKKEEEVIDGTHKSGLLEVELSQDSNVNSYKVKQKLADEDLGCLDLRKSKPLQGSKPSKARKRRSNLRC